MAKKNTAQQTMAKMVIDVFHKKDAKTKESAIPISAFKNVKMTASVISYTIANLMQDGVVKKTDDDRYYFDDAAWRVLEKKAMRGYWFMIALPVLLLIVILALTHWDNLSSAFFR